MSKPTIIVLLCLWSNAVLANEMFSTPPTDYVISGSDVGGNESAYSITAKIHSEGESRYFDSLNVRIYDKTISVGNEILEQAENPDLSKISVVNDSGVFGSYFYIGIPFGERGRCREARRNDLYKEIFISSLGVTDGEELRVRISDPCDSP